MERRVAEDCLARRLVVGVALVILREVTVLAGRRARAVALLPRVFVCARTFALVEGRRVPGRAGVRDVREDACRVVRRLGLFLR